MVRCKLAKFVRSEAVLFGGLPEFFSRNPQGLRRYAQRLAILTFKLAGLPAAFTRFANKFPTLPRVFSYAARSFLLIVRSPTGLIRPA